MDLMHIPFSELSIAKTNVRHGVQKADYEDLIPSIRQRGILQPLLVRKNGKGYLAVQSLEKEGLEIEVIPCAIMTKGDDAAAVEASLIENIARLPMDDMDQFEAFQRLLKEGRTIEEIANTFGVTEIMVKRRLAIAKLKASFEANGWNRVEVMEKNERFNEWDFEKTTKKKGGAIFISVTDRGEVEAHEGYLTRRSPQGGGESHGNGKHGCQIRKAGTDQADAELC